MNMKVENQVCSFELAKKLKELGVEQESLHWWDNYIDPMDKFALSNWRITFDINIGEMEIDMGAVSAFTVAELGEMLPEKVCWRGYTNYGGKWSFEFGSFKAQADTEANARAKMLIYLLENKLI